MKKNIKDFFLDNINFCHGTLSSGKYKPYNPLYRLFCLWFWPLEKVGCWCCAAVRGLMYGIPIGFVLGLLW